MKLNMGNAVLGLLALPNKQEIRFALINPKLLILFPKDPRRINYPGAFLLEDNPLPSGSFFQCLETVEL